MGIIPARAGSRSLVAIKPTAARDHPRACGEQILTPLVDKWQEGSSPRVRGAVCSLIVGILHIGIIPARAGSSFPSMHATAVAGDHPRACGEQLSPMQRVRTSTGSSPRVRGADRSFLARGLADGIIPARAGSSSNRSTTIGTSRDHPRACGEQLGSVVSVFSGQGSSPRVRGAVLDHEHELDIEGIIPARAGSRSRRPPS